MCITTNHKPNTKLNHNPNPNPNPDTIMVHETARISKHPTIT